LQRSRDDADKCAEADTALLSATNALRDRKRLRPPTGKSNGRYQKVVCMSHTTSAKSIETSTKAEQQDGNTTVLSFRIWRRRTLEQIMSRKDLSPIARLTAYSIADFQLPTFSRMV
jgi:hypothetical protein